MENCKLLLFDLDGTLLRSDKTISQTTLKALQECRKKGILIGVSTSRGEQNALSFIEKLQPDILIAAAKQLQELLHECDCIRFSDGYWYKFIRKGIAMGNAIKEVKEKADLVIGSNDEDGIAEYLAAAFFTKVSNDNQER